MSLYGDLREQARHLATKEARRPKQASLRRAVSTAYYALFHLLVDDATLMMFGGRRDRQGFRFALGRAFLHQSMAAACNSFAGGTLPTSVVASVGILVIPQELKDLAEVFVTLQNQRHRADYSRAATFTRTGVLALLREMDTAIAGWRRVRTDGACRFFLRALPLWEQLKR